MLYKLLITYGRFGLSTTRNYYINIYKLLIIYGRFGLSTTRNYCGHGVGRVFHTTPNIVHYKNNQMLGTMRPGHIFTIEPMINEGTHDNKVCKG